MLITEIGHGTWSYSMERGSLLLSIFFPTPIDQCWGLGAVSKNMTQINIALGERGFYFSNHRQSEATFFMVVASTCIFFCTTILTSLTMLSNPYTYSHTPTTRIPPLPKHTKWSPWKPVSFPNLTQSNTLCQGTWIGNKLDWVSIGKLTGFKGNHFVLA